MNIQRLAAKLGYVRAELLSKNEETTYWEFIDKDRDEIYKECEDELNQWTKDGMKSPGPPVTYIGLPIVFRYDGNEVTKCSSNETLIALSFAEDD